MTAVQQASTTRSTEAAAPGVASRAFVAAGTVVVIVMLAVLPLLTSLFIHPTLDAADAATRLGVTAVDARALSDASVSELVFGPGAFAFAGPDGSPFYDASERGHLRDARQVLYLGLAAGLICGGLICFVLVRSRGGARSSIWGAIAQGAGVTVIGTVVIGLISIVAFGTVFTLFHQIFFPGGNFTFDPRTQHLVQLYPFAFWQVTAAALGILIVIIGVASWLGARWLSRRHEIGGVGGVA